MKPTCLLLGLFAFGLGGCVDNQAVTKVTGPTPSKTSDQSSYCYVGMD